MQIIINTMIDCDSSFYFYFEIYFDTNNIVIIMIS